MLSNYEFNNPWLLLFLLLVPIMMYLYYARNQRVKNTIALPHAAKFKGSTSWKTWARKCLPIFFFLGIASLFIALARPQKVLQEEEVKAEGIDIMLVTDLSSSMLAQDFAPDRLSASKRVAIEFVEKREYDRIGLVVFAGESYTQCPLTTDHQVLNAFLNNLQCGLLEDGTAIGMGLASAVNRLKESKAESKIVILLTDGVNNSGYIKPLTAAEIAKEVGVKVYCIGVGTRGTARAPISKKANGQFVYGPTRVQIDEELLNEISSYTGGQYFRAVNQAQLAQIYDYIDQLEKTEIEVNVFKRYKDLYRGFLLFGLGLLLLRWLLSNTILRTLP